MGLRGGLIFQGDLGAGLLLLLGPVRPLLELRLRVHRLELVGVGEEKK